MKYILSSFLIAGALIAGTEGCKAKKETTPTPGIAATPVEVASRCSDSITYISDAKVIIDNYCASSCHSAKSHASGIDLSTYENVKAEAQKPRFMGSLNHASGFARMPGMRPKLADSTLQTLNCWIENGLK